MLLIPKHSNTCQESISLQEMKPSKPASLMRLKVLECFVLLSSKSRPTAERVLASIHELPAQDVSDYIKGLNIYILYMYALLHAGTIEFFFFSCIFCLCIQREKPPVLLVSATAFIVLKQLPRAHNQLKRIGKMPWLSTYAEELERGWILLADVYIQVYNYTMKQLETYFMHFSICFSFIQSGKYDLAAEQLFKCLKYNRVCKLLYNHCMDVKNNYKHQANKQK